MEERIIFALDCASADEAYKWVELVGGEIRIFKIGLELFLAAGWQLVEGIQERGGKVMLDLKFHDIPATVAGAVRQVKGRQICFITLHAYPAAIAAAMQAKGDDQMQVLAITLLTSQADNSTELVLARARDSIAAGCDGLVASPLEAAALRTEFGNEFTLIAPGIRSAADAADDQKRTADAAAAISKGSDYVVIGRPIRLAADPLAKVRSIKQSIAAVFS